MLALSAPSSEGCGGQTLTDGTVPEPGGWNRFMIEVEDLAATVDALRESGVPFRSGVITGIGGNQILVNDPSGTLWSYASRTGPSPS